MRWFPKSKIGKISFWAGIIAYVLMNSQYWFAMATSISIPVSMGIIVVVAQVGAGIGSAIAIFKYKDKAILLWMSVLIGLFGLLLVLGEFLFPH